MAEVINSFPGYEYKRLEDGKYYNMYRGTDVGRGGYVYAEPGTYTNVALLDVRNMHGESIIRLNKFGEHTKRYAEIREARNAIKARDFDRARKMLDGKLAKYLDDESNADQLSDALKLICNSTYGIAAATFDNPLKDPRDINNIIALRGALFMRTLQDEIIAQGFRGIHYKTDSVKVPNATPEIIDFIMNFAKKYGYEFEHEATYERICLVNDAVYIARYDDKGVRNKGGKHANEWTATGAQFQHPYVFKTLFSGEPVEFIDRCETKSVSGSSALYLDFIEDKKHLDDTGHNYHFVGKVGLFYPVVDGVGGGTLYRFKDGKYNAATKSKGFKWLEAEYVKTNHLEDYYDQRYYDGLIDDAIENINQHGSFDRFIDLSRPYEPPDDISPAADDKPPWSVVPCGDANVKDCSECPECDGDRCKRHYSLSTYNEER